MMRPSASRALGAVALIQSQSGSTTRISSVSSVCWASVAKAEQYAVGVPSQEPRSIAIAATEILQNLNPQPNRVITVRNGDGIKLDGLHDFVHRDSPAQSFVQRHLQ